MTRTRAPGAAPVRTTPRSATASGSVLLFYLGGQHAVGRSWRRALPLLLVPADELPTPKALPSSPLAMLLLPNALAPLADTVNREQFIPTGNDLATPNSIAATPEAGRAQA